MTIKQKKVLIIIEQHDWSFYKTLPIMCTINQSWQIILKIFPFSYQFCMFHMSDEDIWFGLEKDDPLETYKLQTSKAFKNEQISTLLINWLNIAKRPVANIIPYSGREHSNEILLFTRPTRGAEFFKC